MGASVVFNNRLKLFLLYRLGCEYDNSGKFIDGIIGCGDRGCIKNGSILFPDHKSEYSYLNGGDLKEDVARFFGWEYEDLINGEEKSTIIKEIITIIFILIFMGAVGVTVIATVIILFFMT